MSNPSPNPGSEIFGQIKPPMGNKVGGYASDLTGFSSFLKNIIYLIFVVAGLYTLLNFIMAGFEFIGAGGDSSKISKAWNKIWQSILGIVIMIAAFALAALVGQIIFGRWDYILKPTIPSATN